MRSLVVSAESAPTGHTYARLEVVTEENGRDQIGTLTFHSPEAWDAFRSRLGGGSMSPVRLVIQDKETEG